MTILAGNIFLKYNNNNYFVETGTNYGCGVDFALEAEFKNIRTIELSEHIYDFCVEKYKNIGFKTINGSSLVGTGDIVISSGPGGGISFLGINVPDFLSVPNSPLTDNGTLNIEYS